MKSVSTPLLFALSLLPAGAQTVLFEGARLIDGDGGAAVENAAFVVENGKFTRVGKKGEVALPAGGLDEIVCRFSGVSPVIQVHQAGAIKEKTMAQYLLLLYDDPAGWMKLSPEEMQKATEKYMDWAKLPYTVDSKRLAPDTGRVIRSVNGKSRATDGPYSETKEVLGGYYTIEAANYEEAVQRAMQHPHLEYGGTIEVRQTWG